MLQSKSQFKPTKKVFNITLVFALFFSSALLHASDVLTMKVHKSLETSGFIKQIFPQIEKSIHSKIKYSTVTSKSKLKRRAIGKVDLLLINDPKQEKTLVRQGWAIGRFPIMTSDYLFVGPSDDPAKIKDARNLSDLFIRLVSKKSPFLSLGDQSSIHQKEQSLWHAHALLPKGAKWYIETKTSMKATLKKADKLQGYTLVDRATWLANKNKLKLVELRSGDKTLTSLYSIVLRNSDRQLVNVTGSSNFLDWFSSEQGIQAINNFKINKETVFKPVENK